MLFWSKLEMSVVGESPSEEGCSSSSRSNSSNLDVDDFLEDNFNLDGVQGDQFQPRRNWYAGESSESDYGNVHESVNIEPSSVARMDNLDW